MNRVSAPAHGHAKTRWVTTWACTRRKGSCCAYAEEEDGSAHLPSNRSHSGLSKHSTESGPMPTPVRRLDGTSSVPAFPERIAPCAVSLSLWPQHPEPIEAEHHCAECSEHASTDWASAARIRTLWEARRLSPRPRVSCPTPGFSTQGSLNQTHEVAERGGWGGTNDPTPC